MEGSQDDRYREAAAAYGAALERLAHAYEADAEYRRDLLQEIHLALWRSFAGWDARCSLRTWVYRVAHNAATSHAMRQRRLNSHVLVSLEELEHVPDPSAPDAGRQQALSRLLALAGVYCGSRHHRNAETNNPLRSKGIAPQFTVRNCITLFRWVIRHNFR